MSSGNRPPEQRPRRAAANPPAGAAVPKRAADSYEPATSSFQRFDDAEAFIETRLIPKIDWTSEFGDYPNSASSTRHAPRRPEQPPDDADAGKTELLPTVGTSGAETTGEEQPGAMLDQIDETDRKNLGRNSLLMASGTLVSRILGMVNASLQLAVLGTAIAGTAFKAANTLPNFFLVLLSDGILNAVLIPQITKAMKRPDGGQDFVNRLLTAAFALIAGVALVCTAGAGLLMTALTSLSGTGLDLAIAFAFICMPQVLFYGIFAVLGNILNARGRFGAFGWAPVANNVIAISGLGVFLWMWGKQPDAASWTAEMIWVMAGSATLGIAVQAAILIPPLYRSGFRWRPRWGLRGHGFGQFGRFAGLTFLALVIAQAGGLFIMKVGTYLADASHAQGTEVGNYVHYQSALSLFQMPYSLIAVSLLTALFPQLARAWQRRDDPRVGLRDMQDLVHRGLTLPASGIIPVAVLFFALATPAVRVVYFSVDADQARGIAQALMVMCAAMLGYTIVTLQQRYCFATEQGKTNLWMQSLLTAIQVGFGALAYVVPLEYGLLTICLGMFFGNMTVALVFVAYARRQIGGLGLGSVLALYIRLFIASAIAGVSAWLTYRLVLAFGGAGAWIWQVGGGVAGGVVFIALLVIGAWLMRIFEFFDLVNPVLRRLHLPQLGSKR